MGADDRPGFAAWYAELHPRLSTSVLSICGDIGLAQEVTDEAFARAWERWERVEAMDEPAGWVYTVAINALRRHHRRARLEATLLRRSRHPDVSAPAGELWSVVAVLPERQRAAVVLRYVADLDEATIAGALGVSRSTVSTELTAARRRLALLVEEEING
jgi:RNA polymerase sigma-70 factor (ECF subfamily)